MYDGNLELAKDLSIDEIIDHIAFRLISLLNEKNNRGISGPSWDKRSKNFDSPIK